MSTTRMKTMETIPCRAPEWRVDDDRQIWQSLRRLSRSAAVAEYKDTRPSFKQREEGKRNKSGESGGEQEEVREPSYPPLRYS